MKIKINFFDLPQDLVNSHYIHGSTLEILEVTAEDD